LIRQSIRSRRASSASSAVRPLRPAADGWGIYLTDDESPEAAGPYCPDCPKVDSTRDAYLCVPVCGRASEG